MEKRKFRLLIKMVNRKRMTEEMIRRQPGRILTSFLLIGIWLLLPAVQISMPQVKYDFSGMIKLFLSCYASNNQQGPYFFP